MKHLALALFCIFLFAFTTASGAVTVQITVFCNGGVSYDSAVSVTGSNPTAWDAIKASDAGYTYTDYGGGFIFVESIAGCGGSWGPAFYANGEESSLGVSGYYISDGDQLQFIGPNNDGPTAGILYFAKVPGIVGKGESFKIKVMERSAYSYGGYDRPSSGAEVTVGNETYETGSNGYTEEITLDYDAYYCVAAEKGGYVATYYFSDIPYIQCGVGGPYICSVTVGGRRGTIKYDESSSISGDGFSSIRSVYVNSGLQHPRRSTKVYQKGSGNYSVEKIIKQRQSGIDLSESSELNYSPSEFDVNGRTLSYRSKYEDSIYQQNYLKAAESSEVFRQLDFLNKVSLYNNTRAINFTSIADFQGTAELSSRTFEEDAFMNLTTKARPVEEMFEEYTGSFQIFQRGLLPMNENDDVDCEEDCEIECMKHCVEDLGFSEDYCLGNCTDYCDDYCISDEEDYDLLPCCDGGWANMTKADKIGHSAEGIFNCTSCRNAATPVLIGSKPKV